MSEHVEGTIVLDGLVEGRLPDGDDLRDKLAEWETFVTDELGLKLTLDTSATAFSLLPDNEPVPVTELGPDPQDTIRQALERLLALLPTELRANVFSTLRSSEYRKGQEVQSLYAVKPDGSVDVAKRTGDADTVAPPEKLSWKAYAKQAVIGLVLAAALLGASYLFPPTRKLWTRVDQTLTPTDANKVAIDNTVFDPFFTIVKLETANGGTDLRITLARTDIYPRTDEQLDAVYKAAGDSVSRKLAVEAIARGYVYVELFIEDTGFYGLASARIADLADKDAVSVVVPMPRKKRLERVVIKY